MIIEYSSTEIIHFCCIQYAADIIKVRIVENRAYTTETPVKESEN